jgi:hypothetical protein
MDLLRSKTGMGNFFKGQIGGLAVFSGALTDVEMENLGRKLLKF